MVRGPRSSGQELAGSFQIGWPMIVNHFLDELLRGYFAPSLRHEARSLSCHAKAQLADAPLVSHRPISLM